MANPLFRLFGNQNQQLSGSMGNMANLMNQFSQFKSSFKGDPKQKVQELLDSGQMSQAQFNQLSAMAEQFQSLMKN